MPLFPANSARLIRSDANRIEVDCVVEYEQHGKPLVALVTGERKGKWQLINQQAQELELLAERLYLTPARFQMSCASREEKTVYLKDLADKADGLAKTIQLEELWDVLAENDKEFTVQELTELLFRGDELTLGYIATRHALLNDSIFFKRKKFGFEPRPREVVDELLRKQKADAEKQTRRTEFVNTILSRLQAPSEVSSPLPKMVSLLEEIAAFATKAEHAKEGGALLEEILARCPLKFRGKLEEKAFSLLVAVKHFTPDEDLNLIRFRRLQCFSEDVTQEATLLAHTLQKPTFSQRIDLMGLEMITIDSATTKDIDDALSVEQTETGFRLGVHISDVAALVPPECLLDQEARSRATSIYCPDKQIPMFPPILSEGTLSLVQGEERLALSFLISLDQEMNVTHRELKRSVIRVTHRLSYEEADEILYADSAESDISCSDHRGSVITDNTGSKENTRKIETTLFTLWQLATQLELKRISAGAIQFGRRDKQPRILPDGKIVLEDSLEDTPSHKLISEMMILANETAAVFGKQHLIPLIFRGQESSGVNMDEVGSHLPEGPALEYFRRGFMKRSMTGVTPSLHAGLALEAYAQVTSPIRRFLDLVNQRQLGSFLDSGKTCYSQEEILQLLAEVEVSLDEAQHIQRERNQYWLWKYLEQEQNKELDAVVVRIDTPRPLAELDILYSLYPFHPQSQKGNGSGKPIKRLGEKVRLHIEEINPRKGILVLREVIS